MRQDAHGARAGGEAGATVYTISGADFVELYVGVGAARVRDLFREARENAPAIVFIDEIDAVGRRRAAGGGPVAADTRDEQDQALNSVLAEMDGFSPLEGVIVVGATNRHDILDPALLRPGQFDRSVGLQAPDERGRHEILRVHARAILALHGKGKPVAADVDLDRVATLTRGLAGADLANAMNEAALLAARRGSSRVDMEMVEDGIDRALSGVGASRIVSEEERNVLAYHEAGHGSSPAPSRPRRSSIS